MELMAHQKEDAAFLASKKFAGNFSGMGSGKTLSALEAINLLQLTPSDKVLIICPPIALHMWKEEYDRHCTGGSVIVTKRKGSQKANGGVGSGFDFSCRAFIMSYDIAVHRKELFTKLMPEKGFTRLSTPAPKLAVMICDESHALKSHKAKRTVAILGKGGICEFAEHSWLLTGTPQTRWNDDLFPFLCRADNKGLRQRIGSVTMNKFQLQYCATQERRFGNSQYKTRITVGNRNTDQLNKLIFNEDNPLAVRRTLQEVWDAMPPITNTRLVVDLAIDKELGDLMGEYDGQIATGIAKFGKNTDDLTNDLRRGDPALATIRRLLGLHKVCAVVGEIMRRHEDGLGPILVGAWHTEVIDRLLSLLSDNGLKVAVLDGRTSHKQKLTAQNLFNNGLLDVLVGQIAAMGVSINLQKGGNRIIVAEEDWSPSVMDQFYGRLHRMGQKKPVHVDTIVSNTKIDKAINRIASSKRREHTRVLAQEVA